MEKSLYRLRVILDTEEDVVRDIVINEDQNLRILHERILQAFELEAGEMASFYLSDEEWSQGEEISLVDFESPMARQMQQVLISEVLQSKEDRLIYVYDLLNLWTFFLEVLEILPSTASEEKILKVAGERPDEAPQKNMEGIGDLEELSEDDSYDDLGSDDDEWDDRLY